MRICRDASYLNQKSLLMEMTVTCRAGSGESKRTFLASSGRFDEEFGLVLPYERVDPRSDLSTPP